MSKINRLSISSFRGSRKKVDLVTNAGSSILLYGDNGTGKSSFADGIEWLLFDKISHLSGEEVESHGGIKNALASDADECFVEIDFSRSQGQVKKNLKDEKGKLKSELSFGNKDIASTLSSLTKDNLILRNSELVRFILATKTNRLEEISKIIGFDSVTQTKTHLKKALSEIKSTIKAKGFEASITKEKSLIAQHLGELINTEEQFLAAVNNTVAPLNLGLETKSFNDLVNIENELKKGVDPLATEKLQNLVSISGAYKDIVLDLQKLNDDWATFWVKREKLIADKERLQKINMSKLLDEASHFLSGHMADDCPLCLQIVDRNVLKESIVKRIAELKELREELSNLDTEKRAISTLFTKIFPKLETASKEGKHTNLTEHLLRLQEAAKSLKDFLTNLSNSTIQNVQPFLALSSFPKIIESLNEIGTTAKLQGEELSVVLKSPRVEVATKIAIAKTSFSRLIDIQKESDLLVRHQNTMEKIVSEFNLQQKLGMEAFLNAISSDMNTLYTFMNSDEKVDDVKLICLTDEKTGEFNGIAVSLKFHGQEIGAPKKYLSESHLNCLGLCLFLSSVKHFNQTAKFFILDDVISSFDKNHRVRFGQLLIEKFSDYQVIALTHETEWFEYLSSQVKGIGWTIQKTNWSAEHGTSLFVPLIGVKQKIEKQIEESNEDDLGNSLRKFSEKILKEICQGLEAPLAFRMNERNESRQFDELYSGLRGRLNSKSPPTSEISEFKRLSTCQFLANKGSHDNSYKPNIADMKVAYADLLSFEAIFFCESCGHFLNVKFLNSSEKTLNCKCGEKKISWKP
jgi:hypothetical protein